MTATLVAPAEPTRTSVATVPEPSIQPARRNASVFEHVGDALLKWSVLGFAAWTGAYWIALVTNKSAALAVVLCALGIAVTPLALRVWERRFMRTQHVAKLADTTRSRRLNLTLVLAGCLFATVATGLAIAPGPVHWVRLWVCAGLAVVIGTVVALRWLPSAHRVPHATGTRAGWIQGLCAFGLGLGAAALSLFVNRPDADDIFYVNHAQWVADHGTFATRDTIFSDQVFYRLAASRIIPSYEGLIGATGWLLHVPAGDVAYYVIPPVATFLSVLAIWRVLRTWGVMVPALALAVGLFFLIMGGANHASFGNLYLGRIWQGKVIFLSVGIPLIFALLTEWSQRPSASLLPLLFAAGVASVGLSDTAPLLVPIIAVVALFPLATRARRRAAVALVALCAVAGPLLLGAIVSNGETSSDALPSDPASIFSSVFGGGVLSAVALFALLTGWLLMRDGWGRAVVAMAGVGAVFSLTPDALPALAKITGHPSSLWRLLWVAPVAPLVGALATRLWGLRRAYWGAAATVAVVALIGLNGVPIWSASNRAQLTSSPEWKVDQAGLAQAKVIATLAKPGSTILAPLPASQALTVLTTRVHTVDPRDDYASHSGNFHTDARRLLYHFIEGMDATITGEQVAAALRTVPVAMACVYPTKADQVSALQAAGYVLMGPAAGLVCYSSQ